MYERIEPILDDIIKFLTALGERSTFALLFLNEIRCKYQASNTSLYLKTAIIQKLKFEQTGEVFVLITAGEYFAPAVQK
jgi:hypothetical protein